MKVFEAVAAVMNDVGAVKKDGRNDAQNFNFRGIDAVVNALSPAMRKHGLTVYPSKVEHRPGTMLLSGGKTATAPVVVVDYTFVGPEGDHFTAQVVAESFDLGDKATAKAMSVALRTCLLQTFMLPTDDADPDEHTYERQPAQRPADVDQYASWFDAIEERSKSTDAYSQLLSLYNEAAKSRIPGNVLAAIAKAGEKAKAANPQ